MKVLGILFLMLGTSIAVAAPDGAMVRAAKSLLSVQDFPKTFEDLSFTSRMQVLAEGYDELATEYDENGVCVAGCAYAGMTIQEEERMIERASVELERLVELENSQNTAGLQQQTGRQQPALAQSAPTQPVPAQPAYPSSAPLKSQPVQPSSVSSKPPLVQPSPLQPSPVQPSPVQPSSVPTQPSSGQAGGGQTFLAAPVRGGIKVGSDFGERRPPKTKNGKNGSSYHRGVDIRATTGTPLYAPADGKVVQASYSGDAGNKVVIEHPFSVSNKKVQTVFMHMDRMKVKAGQTVRRGQQIGTAGNTGNSAAAHLHYGVKFDGFFVDPLGSKIKPVLTEEEQHVVAMTKGTNYLGESYCIKPGITSTRLKPYRGNDAALRENFPQCTGWCKNYYK